MNDNEEVPTRLDVFSHRGYDWIVAWDDAGYPGLVLGEDGGDKEHQAAARAAQSLGTHTLESEHGFVWETRSHAMAALRAARAAIKAYRSGIALPDWAVKAQSQGWKPPRGWKPKPNDDLVTTKKKR